MAKELVEQEEIKVLFLDVDGVLNTVKNRHLCKKMIKRLAWIIKETQCKICLSTSWRTDNTAKFKLFKELKKKGDIKVDEVYIGDTPTIYHKPRAIEIKQFLEHFIDSKIIKYCVIDDMPLDKPLYESRKKILTECQTTMNEHFVQTNDEIGLTDDNVQNVISILK